MASPTAGRLDFGIRLGIFIPAEGALFSAVSVSAILCYTGNKLIRKYRARQAIRRLHSTIKLHPIDATDSWGFVSLMFAELIKALGSLLNLKWVVDGIITEGHLCDVQGLLRQIGDVGVALLSLFIAFDTFFLLVLRWRASRAIRSGALIGVWLFILLMVAISSGVNRGKTPPYFGNTNYWCWISPKYRTERIVFEYLWMWIAALVMLILYGITALVMRGIIVIKKDELESSATSSEDDDDQSENRMIANLLLFYPAIYILCVLPHSVIRWLDFIGHNVAPAAVIFSSTLFSFSGLFNVLWFKFSRPALVSGRNLDPPSQPDFPARVSVSKASGQLDSHYDSEGSNKKGMTGILGVLPGGPGASGSVSPIVEPKTPLNANERHSGVGPHIPSTSQRGENSGRPVMQGPLRPASRDSAPMLPRSSGSERGGSVGAAGLGRLPG